MHREGQWVKHRDDGAVDGQAVPGGPPWHEPARPSPARPCRAPACLPACLVYGRPRPYGPTARPDLYPAPPHPARGGHLSAQGSGLGERRGRRQPTALGCAPGRPPGRLRLRLRLLLGATELGGGGDQLGARASAALGAGQSTGHRARPPEIAPGLTGMGQAAMLLRAVVRAVLLAAALLTAVALATTTPRTVCRDEDYDDAPTRCQ
ncbi:Fork-head transcriptional regulator FHL1 [Frankliniella fusca]|uniref:Fork-head transcriptional regulator FHL1 n=1 Tax=Frankliniella fusca TaxID=407009 RepID=A0AAE1H2G3_9NEOP|nr:Fork-head transcriptional regulator FHL1 [Frankliniella fusca]